MQEKRKYLLTGAVVLLAVVVVLLKYWDYVTNPWTRDGQVRAQVIQITPRVSGPIVKLPIKDNQLVKAGDLLFEIDPRTFEADLDQARAQLFLIVKILQQKIFDATDACLMICLCIASSVRSEIALEKKDMPDVINATNFPVSILKIFP